ncbi:MAG: TraR/DksA family transcriptional regulator [Candidatus Saelkia tenebricola]|nr:TraR/DksA family transcriptional regulator [Candidatus Saelkia tenebricola]
MVNKKRKEKKKVVSQNWEKYRILLIELKQKISREIRHLTEENIAKSQRDASGEISGYTYHMADMASDSFDRDFSYTLVKNEQELIYLIDEALSKMDSGGYGICEFCNKKITKKRLKAIPYAKNCLNCQEEEEKRIRKEAR